MGEQIEVNFGYRDGDLTFRMTVNNVKYEDVIAVQHPAALKFEADMKATARRFGSFCYITGSKEFRGTANTKPEDANRLITALRRQGHEVEPCGNYDREAGRVLPPAPFEAFASSEIRLPPHKAINLTASQRAELRSRQEADRAALRTARAEPGHAAAM